MNKLRAHFKGVQAAATRYLVPEPYVDRNGRVSIIDSSGTDKESRDELFVNDVIYMLDGPEQRAAEAEVDQRIEDLRTVVRSLMRDLLIVDHLVTIEDPVTHAKRTIVATELMRD